MKKNTKKLLMFGLTSLLLMTGCDESEIVEIDDKSYLQKGNEYTSVELESKVFEPGTHIISYLDSKTGYTFGKSGWGKVDVEIPEVPEGYRYVNTYSIDHEYHGHTSAIVHVFVNEVTVEVEPTISHKTGEIEYVIPGKPVKSLVLE